MAKFNDRIRHAWNAFTNKQTDSTYFPNVTFGETFVSRPDRTRLRLTNERSIIASIYTRIAIDVASVDIRHIVCDEQGRYDEDAKTNLNRCLSLEANLDQGAQAFRQDIVTTLLDDGVVAIVPVDTTEEPTLGISYDINTMRVGKITKWYPQHVGVSVYNEATGKRQELKLLKRQVAIVENPLYMVMNEPNSTLQRLLRKLSLLDTVDEQTSSGKLDLIIQLPYVVKSEARQAQAEKRRQDIEFQLKGSKYGIAYTDGTEKITQLNRPVENTLLPQVEYLTKMLYGQLGLTEAVMDGTADEKAMLNYKVRTIQPIIEAIVQAMNRTFLTNQDREEKKQKIVYFNDPFKLVPLANIADIADKLSRNEIMSSNEIRGLLGLKPSKEPRADQLLNSNMPAPSAPVASSAPDPATG